MKSVDQIIKKITPRMITELYNSWLEANGYKDCPFEIYDINKKNRKTIILNGCENITIFNINVELDIFTGTYIAIDAAIGEFKKPDKHGFMTVEKGVVRFKCNDDLSVYETYVYYDCMHESK